MDDVKWFMLSSRYVVVYHFKDTVCWKRKGKKTAGKSHNRVEMTTQLWLLGFYDRSTVVCSYVQYNIIIGEIHLLSNNDIDHKFPAETLNEPKMKQCKCIVHVLLTAHLIL